jgi:hypothetical protein
MNSTRDAQRNPPPEKNDSKLAVPIAAAVDLELSFEVAFAVFGAFAPRR